MGAHTGRCFRSLRRTVERKRKQGVEFVRVETRWRVPLAIRPFLIGNGSRAQFESMGLAIQRYADFRQKTGQGAPVRAAGSRRGG